MSKPNERVIISAPVTSRDIIEILEGLADRYAAEAQWEYDTITNARLSAKRELCEDLAEGLRSFGKKWSRTR